MTRLTKEDIIAVAGSVDDDLAVEISETGVTGEELVEALAWLSANDAVILEHHHVPHGRVQKLCNLIAAAELPYDREKR
jgi:hypothetical protein